MSTSTIRNKISKAIQHESTTNDFVKSVMKTARRNNKNFTLHQAQEVRDFVIQYVNLIPEFIEEGLTVSRVLGIQHEMSQMIGELEYYWKLERDLIPDNLGLMGITDDAYASMYLLQILSEDCRGMYGRPLLQTDFTTSNQFVRNLLGESIAASLEQKVQVTIENNIVNDIFNQVYKDIFASGFAFGNTTQAYINQKEIEEQVNVQMGAMGIV